MSLKLRAIKDHFALFMGLCCLIGIVILLSMTVGYQIALVQKFDAIYAMQSQPQSKSPAPVNSRIAEVR